MDSARYISDRLAANKDDFAARDRDALIAGASHGFGADAGEAVLMAALDTLGC